MNKRVRLKVLVHCVQILKVNQGFRRRDNWKQKNDEEKEGENEREREGRRKGGREGGSLFIYFLYNKMVLAKRQQKYIKTNPSCRQTLLKSTVGEIEVGCPF